MQTIKTIKIEGAKFYCYHGLYPEEQKCGNNFIVNASISQTIYKPLTEDIKQTVDYVTLFSILSDQMHIKSLLLEDVLQRMVDVIEEQLWDVHELKIEIKKMAPAFGGNCKASSVQIDKFYHK